MTATLSVVVPTFNRVATLKLLLDTLVTELNGLEGLVQVIIGDNASTDTTPEATAAFARGRPWVNVLRHATNVGPEENFCLCLEQVNTPYFWIIGDDDLPRAGALRALVDLLDRTQPDLVYLESRWLTHLKDNEPEDPVALLKVVQLDRLAFARRVHVWTTFISGMVVNRERFLQIKPALTTRRYMNTSLVQLGWVLNVLSAGRKFLHVTTTCVLATEGNSGGYQLVKVFADNFPRIVKDVLGSESAECRAIVFRHSVMFLPNLLWGVRFAHVGKFEMEEVVPTLERTFGRGIVFRSLLVPIGGGSRSAARFALFASRTATRCIRSIDRLSEKINGSRSPV